MSLKYYILLSGVNWIDSMNSHISFMRSSIRNTQSLRGKPSSSLKLRELDWFALSMQLSKHPSNIYNISVYFLVERLTLFEESSNNTLKMLSHTISVKTVRAINEINIKNLLAPLISS